MGMSWLYGEANRDESIATVHAALDAGITLLDTGDFYGMGHNEMLIGEALPTTRELGMGLTAYGVLSRGLISGHWHRDRELSAGDFRGHSPRFSGANLDHNLGLVDALGKVAEQKGITVAQTAIAWVATQGE